MEMFISNASTRKDLPSLPPPRLYRKPRQSNSRKNEQLVFSIVIAMKTPNQLPKVVFKAGLELNSVVKYSKYV